MNLGFLSDYLGVILFYSTIILVIYLFRNKLEKQGPLMYLYKTKFGLGLMDSISKKFRKTTKFLGYVGIVVGFFGFILITYALVQNAYDIIIDKPGVTGGSPVIPGLPIAGLGITFPLVIGWLSLFIIMIVHEFSHGVVARAHNVKVKSSGLAFFGPILGAFVEPDEKDLVKKSHKIQHSIFAAGPFSNIILTIICSSLVLGFVTTSGIMLNTIGVESDIQTEKSMFNFGIAHVFEDMTHSEGVKIGIIQEQGLPALAVGIPENSVVTKINDDDIIGIASLSESLDKLAPGQEITLITKNNTFVLNTTSHPDNESNAYLGIWIYGEDRKLNEDNPFNQQVYKILMWFVELLNWTAFISINIGLINLFPIFITDGARMLKLVFEKFIKDKKKAFSYWKSVNIVALFIIIILMFFPLLKTIFNSILSIVFLI